jgi:hypothetical protein
MNAAAAFMLFDRKDQLTHAKNSLADAIAALAACRAEGKYRKLLDEAGNFIVSTRNVDDWRGN